MDTKNKKFFHELIENISDLILLIDENGKIKIASPSFLRMSGYKKNELKGKSIYELIHPEDLEKIKESYKVLLANPGVNQQLSLRVKDRNGKYRHIISNRKNLLSNPEIGSIVLTGHDITEISELNNKAQTTKDILNSVEGISKVGGWGYDIADQKMFWTQETYKIHGFNPDNSDEDALAFINKSIARYYPEDRGKVLDAFNECVSNGTEYDLICRFKDFEDKTIWVRTIGRPVYENGKIVRVLGTFADITEERRKQNLLEAKIELEDYSYRSTLDEFLQKLLDTAEELTNSNIGFYHFVDEDQETLTLQTWSSNTLKNMCNAEGKGSHYNISQAGVWTECFHKRAPVIHNDYANLPDKKGLPEGHAKITRELVLPLIRNNRILSIVGVGNKEEDYNQNDILILHQLSDLAWNITEYKRSEELLHQRENHLDLLIENSPVGVREEDFSRVKEYFDKLKSEGARDLEEYLVKNPDTIKELASRIKIEAENNESRRILRGNSNDDGHKEISTLIINDTLPVFKKEMLALWNGLSKFECEMPLRNTDGKVIHIFLKLSALPGYEESLKKVIISFVDITNLKNAERELLKNQELAKIKSAELESINMELRKARHATLNIIDDLSVEIEDRKRKEKDLIESETKFRRIFENHSAIKFLIDPETGNIIDANDAAANYYGWTKDELRQMNINQINTDLPENVKKELDLIRTQNKNRIIYEHRLKNGAIRDVEAFSSKIEIGGKDYLHSIIHDITERKKAERELNQSILRYETLFTKAGDGILILTQDGIINSVNESFAKMHGYTVEEMLNLPIQKIDVEDLSLLYKERMSLLLDGQTLKFETKHYHKDGHIIYLEVTTSLIKLGDELIVQAFHRDITEKKEQEENLRKLSKAVDQSPVSIVITDIDGSIEYVNPKFIQTTGYTFEEAVGQNPRVLKSGEQSKSFYKDLWDTIISGNNWSGTLHNKKKNGELFWESAIISPIKNENGETTHFVAIKENITEKVNQEKELKQYREHLEELVKEKTGELSSQKVFLETLVETIPNPVFVLDKNRKITLINKSFENRFNKKRDLLIGRTLADFIPIDLEENARKYDEKLLQKTSAIVYESYNLTSNKEKKVQLVFKASFGKEENKPEGIVGLIVDISEQRKMEQQTLAALEREKELNEMKTNFISMASHEFRTPLTTILASADLLEMFHKTWEDKKTQEHLNKIQTSVEYMTLLLDDVLALSRTDRGKISFSPATINLDELCSKIINQVKVHTSPAHKLIYKYKLPYYNTQADPKLLHHILGNLLTNAIKFSPEGGKVELFVEGVDGEITFTVKDQGIGIPKEDGVNLFEPFYRAKNSSGIEGTGLGLSIVKKYVELHNGEIIYKSTLGKGTQFLVKIKNAFN